MTSPKRVFVLLSLVPALGLAGIIATDDSGAAKTVPSATGTPPGAEGAKAYTLFMGADIAVSVGKDLCPVRGVRGSNWIVEYKGEERLVPTRGTTTGIKIMPNLKLAQGSAAIDGFKAKRGYTFDNDPYVRQTRGLDRVAAMNADLTSMANDTQARADTASNKALGDMAGFSETDDQFSQAAIQASAARAFSPLVPPPPFTSASDVANFTTDYALRVAATQVEAVAFSQQTAEADAVQTDNGDEPGGRLAVTGVDAVEVDFEVSSPVPIRSPYVVTVAYFHPKGARPGVVQSLVYSRELHEIDAHSTRVHFIEGGYPFDFELRDFQLHLFSGGREIPTTVSSRRVDLTRDEAFEYVRIGYISSHKSATLPASPAMGSLPSDLPGRLAEGQFRQTVYVMVSKEGVADAAYADSSCSKRIEDPYLQAIVRGIRFNPALSEGRPVDGVAAIDLRQLKI